MDPRWTLFSHRPAKERGGYHRSCNAHDRGDQHEPQIVVFDDAANDSHEASEIPSASIRRTWGA